MRASRPASQFAARSCASRALVATVAALLLLWLYAYSGTLVYPVVVPSDSPDGVAQHLLRRDGAGAPLQPRGVEIVVARYKADLQWLVPIAAMLNASVTVYCKSPNASATAYPCAQELPNVGNEGHTYLWHITRNYHQLARLTVFLPDTATYGDKLKTWRRFRGNLARFGGHIYYADDHTPITAFKWVLNFLNEVFYGYNFPCVDTRRGGEDCTYFGHTDGANTDGRLAPATPPDFLDWMWLHMRSTRRDMARCGWGNRGMLAASRAAVHKHPLGLYEGLLAQLSRDVFPTAGMFMERLWRRVFLCSRAGELGAGAGGDAGAAAGELGGGAAGAPGRAARERGRARRRDEQRHVRSS